MRTKSKCPDCGRDIFTYRTVRLPGEGTVFRQSQYGAYRLATQGSPPSGPAYFAAHGCSNDHGAVSPPETQEASHD